MIKLIDLEPANHTNTRAMDSMSNEDLITFFLEGNADSWII